MSGSSRVADPRAWSGEADGECGWRRWRGPAASASSPGCHGVKRVDAVGHPDRDARPVRAVSRSQGRPPLRPCVQALLGQLPPRRRGQRLRGQRLAGHDGQQVGPGPRHHLDQRVAAAAGGDPAPVAELVGQRRAGPGRRPADRRRVSRRSASGSSRWVSAPHWVNSTCGRNARSTAGTTAWNARSQPASSVPGGSATLTARALGARRRRSRRGSRCRGTASAATRAG